MKKLTITVCVCSLKRTSLIGLLNSIYKQDFDQLFIITGTQLGDQRNIGAIKCTTDLFVTIDDDCIAHPDFIENGRKIFEDNPELDFAQGRIIGTSWSTAEHFTFITANLWMRTKMIKEVGFNEKLHGCEDLDMCWRALDKGYKYKYNPDCIAYHVHEASFNTLEGQCEENKKWQDYYMRVHPERTKYLFENDKHIFRPISEWKKNKLLYEIECKKCRYIRTWNPNGDLCCWYGNNKLLYIDDEPVRKECIRYEEME